MDRRKIGIAVAGIILFSVAVIVFMPEDGKEGYQGFLENYNQSSVQINYSAEFNESLISDHNYSSFEFYSSGSNYKQVIHYEDNGGQFRNVSFITSYSSIRCPRIQDEEIESSECTMEEPVTSYFYRLVEDVGNLNVTEVANATATRECTMYSYKTSGERMPGGDSLRYAPQVDVCVNSTYGYVESISSNGTFYENNISYPVNLFNITATSVQTEFSGSATPNFDLIADAKCDRAGTVVHMISFSGDRSVMLEKSGEKETYNLENNRKREIFIPDNVMSEGENRFRVSFDDQIKYAECYFPSE